MRTVKGTIRTEKVVNCGGMWARQIGAMAGVNVPLQPVKHQYVITEKIEGLAADAATIRDPDKLTYFKEEVGGLVFGGYEPTPFRGRKATCPPPSSSSSSRTTSNISSSTWKPPSGVCLPSPKRASSR